MAVGTSTSASICGNCSAGTQGGAQFCEGCGQPLWENCSACATKVRIGQTFCHSCGNDLKASLLDRLKRCESVLLDAEERFRSGDIDQAYDLARRIARPQDYRFKEVAAKAATVAERYRSLRDQQQSQLDSAIPRFMEAMKENRLQEALSLMQGVNVAALPEEVREMLHHCREGTSEKVRLEQSLSGLMAQRKWPEAAAATERLMQLEKDPEKWKGHAMKIGKELVKVAKQYHQMSQYVPAKHALNAVPEVARDDDYRRTLASVQEVFWLRELMMGEPFVSPNLIQAASRLENICADDPKVQTLCEGLTGGRVKRKLASRWGLLPVWKATKVAWLKNCPVDYWGRFSRISYEGADALARNPTRFHVCLGLGLMELGIGKIDIRVEDTERRGGGWGKLFTRKAAGPQTAWSMDIGSSGVRVVCMTKEGDAIKVVKAAAIQFKAPLFRPEMREQANEELKAAIKKVVEHFKLQKEHVLISVSARQSLGRFVDMPPVKDKELQKLIEKEAAVQIPFLATNEVVWDHWLGDAPQGVSGVRGRPLIMAACRKNVTQDLKKVLDEVGLNSYGLVPVPIAIANLAYLEFEDLLANAAENSSTKESQANDSPSTKPAESTAVDEGAGTGPSTVAILDVGCECSTLIILSRDRFFFRTTDSGGDTFTTALARGLTKTYSEVEKLKSKPVECPGMSTAYDALNTALSGHWLRMQRMATEVRPFMGDVACKGLWICGGGGLQLGFLRDISS